MSQELLVFTHNDLDALGSMLNIEYKWPQVKKKYWHTNYSNIDQIVEEILDYQSKNGNQHLLIPDVSFGDNKEALARLYNSFEHITHIDHHLYPEGFWDDFPNMKVVWDKSKCATLLCNEYLGNKGKNKNLDQLSYLIDVYDLWQTESPHFDIAQDLNEYFWKCDTVNLLDQFIGANYSLPEGYFEAVADLNREIRETIQGYEEKGLINRAGEITLAFVQPYFNRILIEEMKQGKNFVVGISPYGIIKVRHNPKSGYTESHLNQLRKILAGTETIGHMHAFTYKIPNHNFDSLMDEAKRVVQTIQEVCNG